MAFLHRGIGDNGPGSSLVSTVLVKKALRWAAIPCVGIALASWSAATLVGLHSAASLTYARTLAPSPLSMSPLSIEAQLRHLPHQPKPAATGKKLLAAPAGKAARMASPQTHPP
jgi:hypothetical protein